MAPHIQDPCIRWFMLQPGSPVETTLFTPQVGGEVGPRATVDMVKRKSVTDFPGIAYPACSMTHSLNNKICQNLKLHLIWIS
jgi:hypothetical protein